MSSKTKEVIESQKRFFEAAFQNRQAELKGLNLEDGKVWKDAQLRHLRAKVRQANRRLLALSKIQKKVEASASRKRKEADKEPIELKSSKRSGTEPPKKKAKQEKRTAAA
jgi:hypothetical protein